MPYKPAWLPHSKYEIHWKLPHITLGTDANIFVTFNALWVLLQLLAVVTLFCSFQWRKPFLHGKNWLNIEGFCPEWYISSIYHAWDTPFWSGTLGIRHTFHTHYYCDISFWDIPTKWNKTLGLKRGVAVCFTAMFLQIKAVIHKDASLCKSTALSLSTELPLYILKIVQCST